MSRVTIELDVTDARAWAESSPTNGYRRRIAEACRKALAESGEVSPTPNPAERQFCTCDFDPSYTGGKCDTCGKWDPTPTDTADIDHEYEWHKATYWPEGADS